MPPTKNHPASPDHDEAEQTFAEEQFAAPLAELQQLRGEWEQQATEMVSVFGYTTQTT